jgi:hypothetical protein
LPLGKGRGVSFLHRLAVAILILAGLLSCSVESPELPTWDVTVSIPVVTEEYTFRDLADDEEFLDVVGDSLEMSLSEAMTGLRLAGELTLDDCEEHFAVDLGAFDPDSIVPAEAVFTLEELWSGADDSEGYAEVPPFCFPEPGKAPPGRSLDVGDAFEWIEVDEGSLLVTVRNGLPVDLGDPSGGCPLKVRVGSGDTYGDSCIAHGPIPAGGETTFGLSLAGRHITAHLEVAILGGSPGSGDVVPVSEADEVAVIVIPSGIRASRALGRLPRHTLSRTETLVIDDSTKVMSGDIATGGATFTLANGLPVAMDVEVKTGNLHRDSQPLRVNAHLGALAVSTVHLDLSGFRIETVPDPGNPWQGSNEIIFEVVAETERQDALVEISSQDSISVVIQLERVELDRVLGTLRPTRLRLDEEHSLKFPEGFERIDPKDAIFVISITNSAMVGGAFSLRIEGERDGVVRRASFDGAIAPAEIRGTSVLTRCEYSSAETHELISIFPERVRVEGEAIVWGQGMVTSADSLRGNFGIVVPLVFRAGADTFTTEPRRNEISEDVSDAIEDGVASSYFVGSVISDAPISGAVRLFFGADSATAYSHPLLVLPGGEAIAFGSGDDPSGAATFEVGLSHQGLEVFVRDAIWAGLEVRLDSTETYVTLRPDDAMRLEGRIELVKRVN